MQSSKILALSLIVKGEGKGEGRCVFALYVFKRKAMCKYLLTKSDVNLFLHTTWHY